MRNDLRQRVISTVRKINTENPGNAFITPAQDGESRSRIVEQKLRSGTAGALGGYLIGIKDNICMQGLPTTCGSAMLRDFIPPYNATVVGKIQAAGGIIIGKTNLDEFGMGSTTQYSAFGPVDNPRCPGKVPGGSSGGSAAAVAGGLADIALGSDTGGSVRQPAAFCGIVGLKPTYGRVSRYGLVAYASSLDQIGILANSVCDAARMLGVIAGQDRHDATSLADPVPDYLKNLDSFPRQIRIGIVPQFGTGNVDPAITEQMKRVQQFFREEGFRLSEVELPHISYAVAAYYIIATAEASSNLARYDGFRYGLSLRTEEPRESYRQTRQRGFGDEVIRRIMLGTYVLSAGYYDRYYTTAQRVRHLIRGDFEQAFRKVDVIFAPVTAGLPFDQGVDIDDPLKMYLADVFTVPVNLAGLPALAIPVGEADGGLPIGAQLIGKGLDEETILRLGHYIEQQYEWD